MDRKEQSAGGRRGRLSGMGMGMADGLGLLGVKGGREAVIRRMIDRVQTKPFLGGCVQITHYSRGKLRPSG